MKREVEMTGRSAVSEPTERQQGSAGGDGTARADICERCIVIGAFLAALSASALALVLHLSGVADTGRIGLALSCSVTATIGIFTLFYLHATRQARSIAAPVSGMGGLQD